MRLALAGIAVLLVAAAPLPEAALGKAGAYLHVREITPNQSPEINRFLAYMGLPPGLPWCAAFAVYAYSEAATERRVKNPLPRIARVSTLLTFARANAGRYQVLTPADVLARGTRLGDLPVWLYGGGPNPNGHIGLSRGRRGGTMWTREGNTSSGEAGSQRDGDGVYDRQRPIARMHAVIRVRP